FEHEVALLKPRLIVCLGATAAKALLGRTFSVMKSRGIRIESDWAEAVFTTVHPSSILRGPPEDRARNEKMFIADLRKAAAFLENPTKTARGSQRARSFGEWHPTTTARPSGTSSAPTRSSREC